MPTVSSSSYAYEETAGMPCKIHVHIRSCTEMGSMLHNVPCHVTHIRTDDA